MSDRPLSSLENVGYGKPLFVPLACNCHVPEGNLKPCPLHGPQRSDHSECGPLPDGRWACRANLEDESLDEVGGCLPGERFETAALRWAQAYKALQDCKRLHADMTPAGYEAYCMDELKKEAMLVG